MSDPHKRGKPDDSAVQVLHTAARLYAALIRRLYDPIAKFWMDRLCEQSAQQAPRTAPDDTLSSALQDILYKQRVYDAGAKLLFRDGIGLLPLLENALTAADRGDEDAWISYLRILRERYAAGPDLSPKPSDLPASAEEKAALLAAATEEFDGVRCRAQALPILLEWIGSVLQDTSEETKKNLPLWAQDVRQSFPNRQIEIFAEAIRERYLEPA